MLFLVLNCSTGQTRQFRYKVKIRNSHKVKENTKSTLRDTVELKLGTVLTYEKKLKINKKEILSVFKDTIKKDTILFIPKEELIPESSGWATIKQDDKDKSILYVNYWLQDKYDKKTDYYIKLENRDYVKFWFSAFEGGAITIPFKYRKGFSMDSISVSSDFSADFGIGAYIGYSIGQINYSYRRHEDVKPSKWSISVGPFLGVSRVILNKNNTITAEEQLIDKEEKNIAVISPGLGVMTSVYDFKIGIFWGRDIAVGSEAQKWDFNKRTWFGVGIGYNILLFGKAKE